MYPVTTEYELDPAAKCGKCGKPVPPTVVVSTEKSFGVPEVEAVNDPSLFLVEGGKDIRVCQGCYEAAVKAAERKAAE